MAGTVILMAILGCGDAGTSCEPVGVAPVRYESVSACIAAQDDVLARTDVMFPVVMAECRPSGAATPATYSPKGVQPASNQKRPVRQASLRT